MSNEEIVLSALRSLGRSDALSLRSRGAELDGTALIAEEHKAPAWREDKDYSNWPVGAPVAYDGQVYKLIQPHNAAHYPGSTPANTPALWSIVHTTDPKKAKLWAVPFGTSGLYMRGECCVWEGQVWRSKSDYNAYSPADYPANWEVV